MWWVAEEIEIQGLKARCWRAVHVGAKAPTHKLRSSEGVFDYGAVLAAFPFVSGFAELQGVGSGGSFAEGAFGGVQIVRNDTEAQQDAIVHVGDASAQAGDIEWRLRGAVV